MPASSESSQLNAFSQFAILLRAHLKVQSSKLRYALEHDRLKSFTVIGFLVIYAFSAYFLLNKGFTFIGDLPAAGSLIVDRLIHVVFFGFMIMLTFSTAITAYISIYRGRDLPWLLSLPISHRVLFLWKCVESALFSSWGLLVIITPLLFSFAEQRDVSPLFYLKSALIMVPFLTICASVGTIGLIIVGRFLNRRQFGVIAGILAGALVAYMFWTAISEKHSIEEHGGYSAAMAFQSVLGHTAIATHPLLPSTWLSTTIIEWSYPYGNTRLALLQPCLLLSYSLALPLLLTGMARLWFYPSWNRSLQSNAISANSRLKSPGHRPASESTKLSFAWFPKLLGRPMGAVARKDLLTFVREPAQWVQFTLIFGLLAIYSASLDHMHEQLDDARDLYLVAFLNLAVAALALSTLTTRFIFPQFSLEGQKFWILAMSPIRLEAIVVQKFITSAIMTSVAMLTIVFLSSHSLKFTTPDSVFFGLAMLQLSLGLNGLSVGLGVIFPNLHEDNTAKIVSGFGGTLCLVLSFLFIISLIFTLVAARSEIFYHNTVSEDWFQAPKTLAFIGLSLVLTVVTTFLPLLIAQKRLKNNGLINKI